MKYYQKYTLMAIAILLSMLSVFPTFGQHLKDEEPVKVTYRKDCIYYEPEFNMPVLRQPVLHRVKTYADGKTVTESAYSLRWSPIDGMDDNGWWNDVYSFGIGDHLIDDGSVLRYGPLVEDLDDSYNSLEYGQYFRILYHTIGVPDLSKLRLEVSENNDHWGNMGNHYKYYSRERDIYFNPDAPVEGWYYYIDEWATFWRFLFYNDYDGFFRNYRFMFQNIGYILYADGQLFDFYEYKPTYDVDFRMKDATMPSGAPAKVVTYECRRKYVVGPDDYWAIVDTIYQLSPEEARQWKPVAQTIGHRIDDIKPASRRPLSRKTVDGIGQNVLWRKHQEIGKDLTPFDDCFK